MDSGPKTSPTAGHSTPQRLGTSQCPEVSGTELDPWTIIECNFLFIFINVPIAPQIQALLENPEIQNSMNYRPVVDSVYILVLWLRNR